MIIPPTLARPQPADLLLCRHHYLVSRAALAALGAAVIDMMGDVVDPVQRVAGGARHE